MEINTMAKLAYGISRKHGWYDKPDSELPRPLEIHALIVSEVAEATEEVRNKKGAFYFAASAGNSVAITPSTADEIETLRSVTMNPDNFSREETLKTLKPKGEAVELADAVIRIMDYFERNRWDLEAVIMAKMHYNERREYRHGGKTI